MIKVALRAQGLECQSHKAALLFEPWEVRTGRRGALQGLQRLLAPLRPRA